MDLDINGTILGVTKDPADDSHYVRFHWESILKDEITSPQKYSIRMDVFEGLTFTSGILCWVGYTFDLKNMVLETEFALPMGVKGSDLGVKHMIAFTIDWKNEIDETPEGESNNVVVWNQGQLPVLPDLTGPQAQAPDPWGIDSVSALVGSKNSVTALVKNRGNEPLPSSTLELHLRTPPSPTTPFKHEIIASSPIPELKPNSGTFVSIVADRDFVIPPPRRTGVKSVGNVVDVHDLVEPQQRRSRTNTKLELIGPVPKSSRTTEFDVAMPFFLTIKGSATSIGFGAPPRPTGVIKIPGKK